MNIKETLSILFYLRRDKSKNPKLVPIYMRITVNGKRAELSIKRGIDPEKWNKSGGFAKGTKEEAKQLNHYIDILRSKVHEAQRELMEKNEMVTAKVLINKIIGRTKEQKSLVEVFEYHNKLMEERKNIDYAPATCTRYKTTLSHIKDFLNKKYNINDILLSELNFEFITDFEHYLKTVRNCNNNTSLKYIRNFRKIVSLAVNNDWLIKDPFVRFKMKLHEVKRDFLSKEEIEKLEEKIFVIPRLEQVRDIFIFSCYTGLSYSDVAKLAPENIRTGIDGKKWIFTERSKTKTTTNFLIFPKPLEIIEKYKDHPATLNKGKLLPVISNQRLNSYLKEVAELAGINKNLTFHIARHTFATTVTLSEDMPIETLSKILGHKNIRTTQIYAKVTDNKVSKDMKPLNEKLSKKKKKKVINE